MDFQIFCISPLSHIMAEELKPVISEPNVGNLRRNSTSIKSSPNNGNNVLPMYRKPTFASSYDGGDARRNSTGKSSSSNKGENISPHYLRASTGSCHDFCKHGRQHAFQEEAKRPSMKKASPSAIINRSISLPSKKVLPNKTMKENEIKINVSAKSSSVKPKPVMVRQSSSPGTSAGLNARRSSAIKFGEKTVTSKAAVKKTLPAPTVSLSPKPSLLTLNARTYKSYKLMSPHKDKNGIQKTEPKKQNGDNKVQKKTLHFVEAESKKIVEPVQIEGIVDSPPPPLPSSNSSQEEDLEDSEYTDSEEDDFVSENDEIINMDEVETSKGNQNRAPRKDRIVISEDKDCETGKLKFRRGKVIDPQFENNGPRRLRFRRGRVLGDNEERKGDSRRRTFKKREVENDTNSTNHNSEKVVLRHQDVQGKKEEQGLFNNVIEETASKLVESRKSKVKALVGAFESVISLQESKPNTQTAS